MTWATELICKIPALQDDTCFKNRFYCQLDWREEHLVDNSFWGLVLYLLFHPKHQVQLHEPCSWLALQKPMMKSNNQWIFFFLRKGLKLIRLLLQRKINLSIEFALASSAELQSEATVLFYRVSSFQNRGGSPNQHFPTSTHVYSRRHKKWTPAFIITIELVQNTSAWAMTSTACPGESNFVCTQKLCFCYSLQFAAKQTLFCFRQPLSEQDTDIWFRIFLFMQWLTNRKFYNQNSLSPWPFFLFFTNTVMLPSNLFPTS